MASTHSTPPSSTKLELRTAYGPVYRDVLNTPPRDCTPEEIPVIDLSRLYSEQLEDRKSLAKDIRAAAHLDEHVEDAKRVYRFFKQPESEKMKIHRSKSKYFNGWKGARQTNISPNESIDVNESMAWRYEPQHDPDPKDPHAVPEEIKPWIRGEAFVWEGTAHLLGFKEEILAYWAACLTLARRLVRIFALSLDLSEDYFDSKATYPGADCVFNYYPPTTEKEKEDNAVGLGSHTDLQLFTPLWQDNVGGLQVLNKDGQWIKAPPVAGTIVVNIGDFMMRLCNDIYKSTVHRVYNRATTLANYQGLNFNCMEGVIQTCTSKSNPPLYEQMSCGDYELISCDVINTTDSASGCQLRFSLEERKMKERMAAQKSAPSAVVIAA